MGADLVEKAPEQSSPRKRQPSWNRQTGGRGAKEQVRRSMETAGATA